MNTGLIVLFVVLGICLLIGLPVAFSIGISCMALLTVNGYPPLDIVVQRMASGAKSFNMMAMPMFIFAGSLMVYGSTPRLMKFANMMLRKMPGGLGATALAACGFFGAVSGSGVASAAAIGKIIGPEMLEQKYPRGLTVGLIAAGGTMACIIPPSIVMVVYASSSGASVGDMFLAGFVPGFISHRRSGGGCIDHHYNAWRNDACHGSSSRNQSHGQSPWVFLLQHLRSYDLADSRSACHTGP